MEWIKLYAEDFDRDVWKEYCDTCGVSYDAVAIKICFEPKDVTEFNQD